MGANASFESEWFENNKEKELLEWLNSEADIDSVDSNGFTAIFYATFYNRPRMLATLLYDGADVNYSTIETTDLCPQGTTSLHIAAKRDALECASLLIVYGIDITASDIDGNVAEELCHDEEEWKLMLSNSIEKRTIRINNIEEQRRRTKRDIRKSVKETLINKYNNNNNNNNNNNEDEVINDRQIIEEHLAQHPTQNNVIVTIDEVESSEESSFADAYDDDDEDDEFQFTEEHKIRLPTNLKPKIQQQQSYNNNNNNNNNNNKEMKSNETSDETRNEVDDNYYLNIEPTEVTAEPSLSLEEVEAIYSAFDDEKGNV